LVNIFVLVHYVVVYRLKNYMTDFDEHFKNIVLTDTKKV